MKSPQLLVSAVLLSIILSLSTAAPVYQLGEEWHLWKAENEKMYTSDREELERHLIWLSNKKYIDGHNANKDIFGYTLAMNQYGDMTDSEYQKVILTYQQADYSNAGDRVKVYQPELGLQLPDSLDWRTRSAVSKVKNQGNCGSSYAFSATGSIEGASALGYGYLERLSEQNLIDCSIPEGNHGCNGGNMYNSFMYVIDNEGIDTADGYPYQAMQMGCNFDSDSIGADISGIIAITRGNEYHLQSAVATAGPISVAVDASPNSFRFYAGGVYDSSRCSSLDVNHAMLVTGYGTYNSRDYWLVKNSWGTNWGMYGYIMMSRNRYNQCGIATDASYPTL